MSSIRVAWSSCPCRVSNRWIRCSAAVQPVHSIEWMFASIRKAGLSVCGPVSVFVTVTSQMSRPSYDLPIDSSAQSPGASSAQARSVSVSSSYP